MTLEFGQWIRGWLWLQHACKIDHFFCYTHFLAAKTQQTEIITNFEFRLWEVAVCSRSFFFLPFCSHRYGETGDGAEVGSFGCIPGCSCRGLFLHHWGISSLSTVSERESGCLIPTKKTVLELVDVFFPVLEILGIFIAFQVLGVWENWVPVIDWWVICMLQRSRTREGSFSKDGYDFWDMYGKPKHMRKQEAAAVIDEKKAWFDVVHSQPAHPILFVALSPSSLQIVRGFVFLRDETVFNCLVIGAGGITLLWWVEECMPTSRNNKAMRFKWNVEPWSTCRLQQDR